MLSRFVRAWRNSELLYSVVEELSDYCLFYFLLTIPLVNFDIVIKLRFVVAIGNFSIGGDFERQKFCSRLYLTYISFMNVYNTRRINIPMTKYLKNFIIYLQINNCL